MNDNSNSFWRALKTSKGNQKIRVVLGVLLFIIKWAWRIYRVFKFFDDQSDS